MKKHGPVGFFVGWQANVLSDVPFAAFKMVLFEGGQPTRIALCVCAVLCGGVCICLVLWLPMCSADVQCVALCMCCVFVCVCCVFVCVCVWCVCVLTCALSVRALRALCPV